MPDCFGFGWTLPTVASHSGIIGFSTQKLMWRHRPFHGDSKIPFEIGLWEGVDGKGPVKIISAESDRLYKDYLPFSSHPELPIYSGELLMDVHATGEMILGDTVPESENQDVYPPVMNLTRSYMLFLNNYTFTINLRNNNP